MKKMLLIVALALTACSGAPAAPSAIQEAPMTLNISSTAFAAGQAIPSQYTCKGKGISPPLAWSGAPTGVKYDGALVTLTAVAGEHAIEVAAHLD